MKAQYIRNLLDLPESVPRCVVEINTFDAPGELRDNVEDYVITDTVAEEMRGLVDRIVASVRRHEPGDGHYVHGAFGSGKSHFMGILGLILSDNPVIWEKDHPVIREIQTEHGAWLAENPILVVPIYMLGKKIPFQYAMYESANERLAQLGYPPCQFSEAGKVIERFQRDAQRYGDVVWQEFQKATGYSQERFQRMAAGDTEQRDAIAQAILQYEGDLADVDRRMLYPDSISRGVEILTRHAQAQGFKGVVYLVDELILYLTGKPGKEWLNEFGDVVAAVDNRRTHQVVPLWLVVARQKDIPDIAPAADAEVSERAINEEMEHHQDRFPRTTRLPDRELVPIVEERVLRRRPSTGSGRGNGDTGEVVEQAIQRTVNDLAPDVRETLVHDFTLNDFQRLYPFHPALITTLIDVTARLSRERTAIRLLYELLIERHPELMLGELVPYASLFDTVFEPEGVSGDRQHPELEAVWDTCYNRLRPIIDELSQGEASNAHTMQEIVKTVLLAQLSTSLRDQITVERILHLNYTDLKGRTDFGSQTRIHSSLNQLANRTELVNFQPNPQAPAKATVSITVTSGPQLSDALKRVPWNVKMRHDAFAGLLRPLLGNRSLRDGELQGYSLTWRGIERSGRVLFRNVRELLPAEMSVPENKRGEFTLFVDYPWDDEAGKGASDDRAAIERGRQARGETPVGFWLPQMLDETDLKDLDEYAQLLELENSLDYYLSQDFSKRAREEIANKLPGYRQTKERNLRKRLTEAYLGGEVTFLDPAIQPNLFVESMNDALDRIAREVFRRLHPHHPRFQRKVTTATLRRFLDEVLVKAEQSGGAVDKNVDREDLARSIGEPLEIVEVGTNKIGLRSQSRYLVKVNDLAQGRKVDADKVRRQLQQAFGFTDEVVDLFLLYLIKGKGYRVLRNGKPVDASTIDFGRLDAVALERGQQLEVHQWTQAKTEIADTWGGQFHAPELTIAAQDELWQEVGRLARDAERLLKRIQGRLDDLIRKAGGTVGDAARMQSIAAALDLNRLPQRDDLDSYDGLRALLEWKPEHEGIDRRDAKDVIRQRSALDPALDGLSPDTVKRISVMANGGDSEAVALQKEVRRFLTSLQRQADLNTHVQAWSQQANALIDKRLSERTPDVSPEGEGKPVQEEVKEKRSEGITITEAALVVRGQKRRLTPIAQQSLENFFEQAADPDVAGPVKVEVHVEPDDS